MKFLQSLKLLLPALIPSWNFFDIISSSPRIQYCLFNLKNEPVTNWKEFRPRPKQLSLLKMTQHMLWNPTWNESLFLVSCAERLMKNHTEHSENEILQRIEKSLDTEQANYLQFRLLFIHRQGKKLKEDILFTSRQQLVAENSNEA